MSVYQEAYHLPEFTYDYEKLKIEQRGPVYICSFNDADNLNAMSYAQMAEFNDFLIKVRMDKDCRVIVLTGEGRSFCAGFNLNDLALDPPEDMVASFFLPKIVGYARACEILMNPARFDAQKLYEWGFANRVVADDDVLETAVAMAEEMCRETAPFGLRLTKEALQCSLDGTSFENCIKMENRNQVLASNTNDGIMGTLKMNPKNRADVKENPEKYAFHNM